MFRAAAAKRVITPTPGVPMAGHGDDQRIAEGTHDDLYVRVLLVEDGSRLAAFVIADLFAFDATATARVRERLGDLGFDPAYVMVAATHTHAGPAGFIEPHDEDLLAALADEAAAAAAEAGARLTPVTPLAGVGLAEAVAAHHGDRDAGADDRVWVLRFQDAEERPIAAFINFACHPTVLGRENRKFSADFPGAAVAHFEVALALMGVPNPEGTGGKAAIALFANGACGDVSTRFTQRAATFAEAEVLGSRVAEAAWSAWDTAIPLEGTSIAALQRSVSLPLPGGSMDAFTSDETEIQAIRIGDCVVLGVPFELSGDVGERIRRSVPTPVLVVGYANDHDGGARISAWGERDEDAAAETELAPEAADVIVDRCAELIREVLAN